MPKVNLNKLIDAWDPILQKAFLDSIKNITDQAQIEQIAVAIRDGSIEAALKAVGIDPVLFRPMDKAIAAAYEAGGNIVTSGFPDVGKPGELKTIFQFNVRNPAAEAWLKEYSSSLVTEIVDDQRNMIQQVMERGLANGDNPREIALDLVGRIGPNGKRSGGLIGLTSSQAEWVQNYSDALASDSPTDALNYNLRDARFDNAVRRAAENGEPLTADQIDAMTTSYTNRALRYRAEAIARTEAMAALHEAQGQAVDQAIESGAVDPENIEQIWRATKGNRTRQSHKEMDGQVVKYGEKFISGLGNELAYPGDPDGPAEDVINCFPAGTKVQVEDIVCAYRRWHEGKLFEIITASGIKLSATPNHPILSSRGLIAISLLNEGDDVICYNFREDASFIDPDIKDIPTCIEEKFNSLASCSVVVRDAGLPVDFHGDGSYSNVDIVPSAGMLMNRRSSSVLKPIDNFKFAAAKKITCSNTSVSAQVDFPIGSFPSSDSSMRSSDLGEPSFSGELGILEDLNLRTASESKTIFFDNDSNGPTADFEFFGDEAGRITTLIKSQHLGGDQGSFCGPLDSNSVTLRSDRIVSIRHFDFSGYVYNFETKTGRFMAENVVVGNCRCWREFRINFYAGLE